MTIKRILLAVGVVLLGFIAAWPFRQSPPRPSSAQSSVDAWPQPPRFSTAIRLDLSPSSDPSPAPESLTAPRKPIVPIAPTGRITAGEDEIDKLGSPPALSAAFRAMDNFPASPVETPAGEISAAPRREADVENLESPENPPTYLQHRVTNTDTLPALAQHYLGSAARAGEIYAANRDVLENPNLLPLGKMLRIPVEKNK